MQVTFRLATNEDAHLPTYDNTKLVAVNTCPTWGILRYQMHKRMPGSGRALALECGSAMHEVFAWVRLCTLISSIPDIKHRQEMLVHQGQRLFGMLRFVDIMAQIPEEERIFKNMVGFAKAGAIGVLETSSYYDDPSDKRRTLSNMIESSLAYIDRWRWDDRVWVRDASDPHSDVGIEIPFDVVVETNSWDNRHQPSVIKKWRYTGKIDGIHWHGSVLTLGENKTASRLNDAWSMAFAMSSQITGYCIAASVFTGEKVNNADIHGLMIPLPKTYDYGGIVRESVSRKDHHYTDWLKWTTHTIDIIERYHDNPHDAPKYTHSCNRYFRPCSFLPFCDSEREEQVQTITEMVTDEWSPLHKETE